MITEVLFNALLNVVNTLLNFLPVLDLPALGAAGGLITVFTAIAPFMPMSAFTAGIIAFTAVNGFKLAMSIINFVIRKIPTID